MKNPSRNYLTIAMVALLGGFAAAAQAQTVFQDNYNGYTAGTSEFSWGDTANLTSYSVTIASGVGTSGSQGLEWQANFNAAYNGYMASQLGYSGGNPSGNTSVNLSDYTLSFDMAIPSGVGLNNLQVDLQGWAGQWFTGAMTETGAHTINTSAVGVGTGFQHISVNLGTWAAGSGFDPSSQTYQFQLHVNGWELAGGGPVTGEAIVVDNLQVTMVPEPSSLALIGLSAAGLFWLRRKKS